MPAAVGGAVALAAVVAGMALAAGGVALAAAGVTPAAARDPRAELLAVLDAERARAGAPPLHPSAALARAAQRHALEAAARGSLRGERQAARGMGELMQEEGYEAHQWAENLLSGPGSVAELVSAWRRDDRDGTFRRLLDPAYGDVGIGAATLDGEPLYSILVATTQGEAFARDTAGLDDLRRVRAELVARINAFRRRAGAPPLGEDARLDLAAQRHAENMLRRSFFAHRDPAGQTVRERARAAGYAWQGVGENIAEGQLSVEQAVEAWMHSAEHRENILNPQFRDTGVGLALGRDPRGRDHRVLWVQEFGLAR